VKSLIKKIDMTGSIDRQPANSNQVEGLALSQERKPDAQFTTESCMMDWRIFEFSRHNHQQ